MSSFWMVNIFPQLLDIFHIFRLKTFGLHQYFTHEIYQFQDLLPNLQNGLILCDLAAKITSIPILGINRKPVNEAAKTINLEKAIKNLREGGIITGGEWSNVIKGDYIAFVRLLNIIRKKERVPGKNLELG